MFIRTSAKRPMILALRLLNRQVVNGCKPKLHQTVVIKLPVLVAVRAEPVSGVIVPFVGEPHGDTVFVVSPKLFDQPVVEFFGPLAFQKLNNLSSSGRELCAVSPVRIDCVSQSDLFRITSVPSVFGGTNFLNGSFTSERG